MKQETAHSHIVQTRLTTITEAVALYIVGVGLVVGFAFLAVLTLQL